MRCLKPLMGSRTRRGSKGQSVTSSFLLCIEPVGLSLAEPGTARLKLRLPKARVTAFWFWSVVGGSMASVRMHPGLLSLI